MKIPTILLFATALSFAAPHLQAADPDPAPVPRQPGVLRVVAFGDSITGDRPGKPYLHQYMKWSDLVALGLELELGAGKAEVLNMGYAGDATYKAGDRPGALNRVESNILAQKPDIAVILVGGNNFNDKSRSADDLKAQLKKELTEIVSKTKASGAKVLLLQYAEPKAANMAKVWTHLDDGNPVIAEVAKEQGVETIELAPAFAAAEKTQPLDALRNAEDGVHLQPYGEIIIAREVVSKIKSLGWDKAPAN